MSRKNSELGTIPWWLALVIIAGLVAAPVLIVTRWPTEHIWPRGETK